MASFDSTIDVNVHISEAYLLFSDFERFPTFMEGVKDVRRTGDDTLHWRAEIGGREVEWDAKVTELSPSDKIAWASTSGAKNTGEVRFDKVNEDRTQVHMHVEYEPEGFIENVGAALGVVNGRLERDLERFKRAVEGGAAVHDGWRDAPDAVHLGKVKADAKAALQNSGKLSGSAAGSVADKAGAVAGKASTVTGDAAAATKAVQAQKPPKPGNA